MKSSSIIKNIIFRSAGVVILLALWEFAPRFGWVDAQFLPSLSTVCTTMVWLWTNDDLPVHIIVSLWRALFSLLLATTIALPLGFILESGFPQLNRRLDSFFRLMSHVNPFSLAPVFLLFFGIGETEKLAIISLVAFWPILFHTITGVRTIDPLLIKTAHSLNVSPWILAREVLLPGAFPTIITGVRVGAQITMFMMIGAEMLGAQAGLGWMVHNSAMVFHIPRLYAAGVLIILLGILINQVLSKIEKDSAFWRESVEILDVQSVNQMTEKPNGLYAPVLLGVVVGILIFGGREVMEVNKLGLSGPISGNHYQVEDAGQPTDNKAMDHNMGEMHHDMGSMQLQPNDPATNSNEVPNDKPATEPGPGNQPTDNKAMDHNMGGMHHTGSMQPAQ
jgi:NitT/TauT family transport system permease protein